MKLIRTISATTIALAMSAGVYAQAPQTETTIKVKDGKDVTVVGCVDQNPAGKFVLTNVADKKRVLPDYVLATDQDLSKHVGHRVEISGIATDRGDGKLEVKSKTKTDVPHGDDAKVESKSEISGDMPGLNFLSVKSIKMLAVSCR